MLINQLSIFAENKPGRLSAIMDVISENNIDISALSIADTTEYGIVRMIVNNPELAVTALKESGVVVKISQVLAAEIDDTPGGLAKVLRIMTKEGIAIEYMYAFVGKKHGKALMVFKVSEPERALKLLEKTDVNVVDANDIYKL